MGCNGQATNDKMSWSVKGWEPDNWHMKSHIDGREGFVPTPFTLQLEFLREHGIFMDKICAWNPTWVWNGWCFMVSLILHQDLSQRGGYSTKLEDSDT